MKQQYLMAKTYYNHLFSDKCLRCGLSKINYYNNITRRCKNCKIMKYSGNDYRISIANENIPYSYYLHWIFKLTTIDCYIGNRRFEFTKIPFQPMDSSFTSIDNLLITRNELGQYKINLNTKEIKHNKNITSKDS